MAGGPCTRLQSCLSVFLETTGVAVDEFQPLILAFAAALQAQMTSCDALPCPDIPHTLPADALIGINSIDQGAADMAGYGMKGLFVAQDIEQVEEVYGEKNTLWGNTEIKVFHAPTNDLTAHRIADRLMGEGTVSNPTEQHQGGFLGRRSTSYGHVGRPMVTHDEMMELPAHLQIIRMKGLKPILAHKIDYRTDHAFAGKAA